MDHVMHSLACATRVVSISYLYNSQEVAELLSIGFRVLPRNRARDGLVETSFLQQSFHPLHYVRRLGDDFAG